MEPVRFVQLLVFTYLTCSTSSNYIFDNFTIDGDTADAEMLISIGRQIKKPLLTLIGMAIRNQNQCSEWTRWTSCTTVNPRYFGIKKRTRTCSSNKSSLKVENGTLEEDFKICEGFCPKSYILSANGYCLKLYRVGKYRDEAEKMCRNDGGHLVYIDSDAKFKDVKTVLEGVSDNYIWIEGHRKDGSSPWETVNGDKINKFYWMPGFSSALSTQLCIALNPGSSRGWHPAVCQTNFFSLCEFTA